MSGDGPSCGPPSPAGPSNGGETDAVRRARSPAARGPFCWEAARGSGPVSFFPLFKKKHFGVWCEDTPSMASGRTQAPGGSMGVGRGQYLGVREGLCPPAPLCRVLAGGREWGYRMCRWASWDAAPVCGPQPRPSQADRVCRPCPQLQGLGGAVQEGWTGMVLHWAHGLGLGLAGSWPAGPREGLSPHPRGGSGWSECPQ